MFCHFCGIHCIQDQKCFQESDNKLSDCNKFLGENRRCCLGFCLTSVVKQS